MKEPRYKIFILSEVKIKLNLAEEKSSYAFVLLEDQCTLARYLSSIVCCLSVNRRFITGGGDISISSHTHLESNTQFDVIAYN